MKTYECLDIVLKEYRDYFTARDLAKVANLPETTISAFRKGEINSGVQTLDKIRIGLYKISPIAYHRFIQLLSELDDITEISKVDAQIINGIEKLPLDIQREIIKTIAANRLFSRLEASNIVTSV